MEIKYFIRTTGERILNESYEQIPYTKLIDKDHRYIEFFIECLEYFSQWDSVFIEDDCILCRDFKNRIEKVISEYPNKIINFFTYPYNDYYTTHESTDYLQNQCTYYPRELSKKLAVEMKKILKQFPKLNTDQNENLALKAMNESHIKARPTLVQHIGKESLLKGHRGFAVFTKYFIDYLDDLSLDYNNLSKEDDEKLMRYTIGKRFKFKVDTIKKEGEE